MIIIYYQDKDGKIINVQKGEGHTLPEFEGLAQGYNHGSKDGKTAHVIEVKDDSLTAYLFGKAMQRKKWDYDTVQEAANAIENALDSVRGLLEW